MIVQTVVAREVDDTASAFGYKAVRLGLGSGPTVHRQIGLDGVSVQSGSIGFPTAGRLTLPDDQVTVAWCVSAPPGTLWNEHDFTPGTMICWGPGSEATWLNREGAAVQIAFFDEQAIRSIADALEERILMPEPGAVVRMPESTRVRRLGALLASFGDPLDTLAVLPANPTALLGSLTHLLAENAHQAPPTRARGLDSRSLVTTCIDYADDAGGRPSIAEMCLAAHVSERRLRRAFNDVFDMAPAEYLRLRSLTLARSRLLRGDTSTVTEAASDLGWVHLGRFSHHYQSVFREAPSHTLAAARRAAASPTRTRSA